MGKAKAGSWRRQWDGALLIGHLLQLLPNGCPKLWHRLEPLIGAMTQDAFLAMLAHHGRPLDLDKRRSEDAAHWRSEPGYNPVEQLGALLDRERILYPAIGTSIADPFAPRAVALFAGLLTLAD
ncbi:hypothetical protein [Jannaschia formosa]|uniref:hypothetical protein n=1 Tax=Jannaschia formosa TaxID=2259592 RepID=UPI000E1C2D12|nr:hypothetical protein [Jannaschia formosa]TFL16227.1 hypothetical protein DR046_21245 [Jannaschia formosa]